MYVNDRALFTCTLLQFVYVFSYMWLIRKLPVLFSIKLLHVLKHQIVDREILTSEDFRVLNFACFIFAEWQSGENFNGIYM